MTNDQRRVALNVLATADASAASMAVSLLAMTKSNP
jgi:hypothetical protein